MLLALLGVCLLSQPTRLVVVGGGAAGFFGAIRASSQAPSLAVQLLEAGPDVLTKVKISGGGRCNVCHDDSKEMRMIAAGYPRGERELMGLLSRFGAADATDWFRSRGVALKTESDGRMFPVSDSSETIIGALRDAADDANVEVVCRAKVLRVLPLAEADEHGHRFEVVYKTAAAATAAADAAAAGSIQREETTLRCRSILFATGGGRDGHRLLGELGVRLVPPVPSLFTLDLAPNGVLEGLAGVSLPECMVQLHLSDKHTSPTQAGGASQSGGSAKTAQAAGKRRRRNKREHEARGPIVITHRGLSGPSVLRLSAFAARDLAECGYRADVSVHWLPGMSEEDALSACRSFAARSPKRAVGGYSPLGLPRRLWSSLVASAGIDTSLPWASISKAMLRDLVRSALTSRFTSVGKSTNKDEFVTAGGADLRDVNARTLESKTVPGLFLAGEVLNADGITGGYNFLNAWSTSWAAGTAIADDAVAQCDSPCGE